MKVIVTGHFVLEIYFTHEFLPGVDDQIQELLRSLNVT